jgi:hypothetical protein
MNIKIFILILGIVSVAVQNNSVCQQTYFEKLNNQQERYNIKSNRVKTKTVRLFDKKITETGFLTTSFSFDNEGKLSELINYHPFKELTLKYQYTYNAKGNLQFVKKINSNDEVIETMEYKYRKDFNISSVEVIQYYNPPVYLYYTINVNTSEAQVFSTLQDEVQIEPKLESYSLTINISDADNQYIVIGDENSSNPLIYSWDLLSANTQSEILSWDISPKTVHNIEKLNPSLISFKYKKDQIIKTIIATNGATIKKEIFKIDANKNVTGYMKYNSKGKLILNESYIYATDNKVIIEIVDLNTRSKEKIEYDNDNKVIKREYYSSAAILNSRVIYTFSGNNLSQELIYNNKEEVDMIVKYDYESITNLLTAKSEYDSQDNLIRNFSYEYTYY